MLSIGHRLIPILSFVVLAALAPVLSCSSEEADASAGGPGGAGFERPPAGVHVISAARQPLERTVEFTGELLADRVVRIAPFEAGRLVELAVDEGDHIAAGAQLGRLDSSLQRNQLREAEARLDTAEARVDQARAERDLQTAEIERRRPLVERNAFPQGELDSLIQRLNVLEQLIRLAESQVEEARVAVSSSRTALGRRTVEAPIDGLVVERHVSVGDMVSPQAPVVTLLDEASLRFVFPLSEQRLSLVTGEASAEVVLDAYPDRPLQARVAHVDSLIDRESRTVDVELILEADEQTPLRHGMFGRGRLVAERVDDAVVVPPEALQTLPDGTLQIWTVVDSVASPVEVSVLLTTENAVALAGVDAGVDVIVSPPLGLVSDAAVYVVTRDGVRQSAQAAPSGGNR